MLLLALVAQLPSQLLSSSTAPETWFHIIGGNASKVGIAADIEAIAEAGISGIQFFHGGWDEDKPWPGVTNMIPCLSDEWEDLVKFTEGECHRRGLTFKMQNCPGWSMSGGPWITPDKAMRKLVCFEPGKMPQWDEDDDFHEIGTMAFDVDFTDDGNARSVVVPAAGVLNHSWAYEPEAVYRIMQGDVLVRRVVCPPGNWYETGAGPWGMTIALDGKHRIEDLRVEIDAKHPIDEKAWRVEFSSERKLDNWEAKAGWSLRGLVMSKDDRPVKVRARKCLVFGHINAKKKNGPAPKEGCGWECDKLDPAGFKANFDGYLARLLKAGVRIDGTLVDSWECGPQTWTWRMEELWRKYNDYELRPWLPALFGYVLKNELATERFLLDWRNTLSRLVEENYYGLIARLAREHGMSVQYETAFGDVITGDVLRFWKHADEPMCEFWSPFDETGAFVYSHDFKSVLPCVSAAHIYGKSRVSAEALTSFKLTFDENFREWKQNIDRHFGRGVTHVVFHTYTHNPVVGGKPPSSSFGSIIGSPFLRQQTWWPYLKHFTRYLEFCGRELERGKPVVDVLIFLGDAVGHKPTERTLLWDNRFKYDYLNQDALLTRVGVCDGRLSLPDGMTYRVLWVPSGTYLSQKSEFKLAELERRGARIVRGDFVPDWESPIAWAGKTPSAWYQRHDVGEDIFFVADFDGENSNSRFCYFRNGLLVRTVDPLAGKEVSPPLQSNECCEAHDLSLELEEKYQPWATERWYRGDCGRGARRIDLGDVRDWAEVFVNGKSVAVLWCRPYACDLLTCLTNDLNEIRVKVTSTWYNSLVHDARLPEAERQTWTLKGPSACAEYRPAGLLSRPKLWMDAPEVKDNFKVEVLRMGLR